MPNSQWSIQRAKNDEQKAGEYKQYTLEYNN